MLVTPTRLDQSPAVSKLMTMSSDAFLAVMSARDPEAVRTGADKDTQTVARGRKRTAKRCGEKLTLQADTVAKITQKRSELEAETLSASGRHDQPDQPLDLSARRPRAASASDRHRELAKRAPTTLSTPYTSCYFTKAVYPLYAKYARGSSSLQGRPTMVERYEPSFQPPVYRFKLPHPHGTIPPHTMTFTAVNRHPIVSTARGRRGKASNLC